MEARAKSILRCALWQLTPRCLLRTPTTAPSHNRGGDRQANAALYIIAISRLRWDPATKAYMRRRLAHGKTPKEVIRCLKRYIARQVHRAITTDLATPNEPRTTQLAAA